MDLQSPAAGRSRSWLERIGLYPPLIWGYVGLLLFMIGDGVEAGFLAQYLIDRHIADIQNVALIFTVYGITVAISAWLSGALSDLWGPRQVMAVGLVIWVVCEVAFLVLGVAPGNYWLVMITYGLRGFGYPLFAYGFLVWISVAAPRQKLGTAVGWFWFALTGGLLALGPVVARYALSGFQLYPLQLVMRRTIEVPPITTYATLWLSLGIVIAGGAIALAGLREPIGRSRLAPPGSHPLRTLLLSLVIAWENPKATIGCIVRIINTAPQNGFLVIFPVYFTEVLGFSTSQWLQLLSLMFVSNVIWNLIFGFVGDVLGWRNTVAWCGGVGCAITTLILYYLPQKEVTSAILAFLPPFRGGEFLLAAAAAMLYGATLAGYVPLSALMPSLAPRNKGAAMSLLNLGAGASNWAGPAIVYLVLPQLGVRGVMWVYAVLYLISAGLTMLLTLPAEQQEAT